jgi:sugar phosphate permease
VAGVIAFAYLTDAPKQAKWLDADQREWLTKTMVAEHGAEAHSHALGKAMKDPLVWTVSGINFFIILSLYGISLWLPRIVQGLTLSSNFVTSLIAAIPYVAAVVAVVLVARNSDKHANRYMHVLVPSLVGAAGFVVAGLISHQPVISLLAISIASAGIYSAIPPMWGMTTGVLSGPVAAAAIGFISALGNVGGFVGPYLSGLINTATGNTVTSLLALAASLALAAVLVLVARQIIERRLRSERLDSATTQGPATVEA